VRRQPSKSTEHIPAEPNTPCAQKAKGIQQGLFPPQGLPVVVQLSAFPVIDLLLVFVLVIHKGHVLFILSCRGADSSRHTVVEEDGAGGMQTHLGRRAERRKGLEKGFRMGKEKDLSRGYKTMES